MIIQLIIPFITRVGNHPHTHATTHRPGDLNSLENVLTVISTHRLRIKHTFAKVDAYFTWSFKSKADFHIDFHLSQGVKWLRWPFRLLLWLAGSGREDLLDMIVTLQGILSIHLSIF